MEFNFFAWIRQGVKQSVLLGVSDAVEQMGLPPDDGASAGEFGQRLLAGLRTETSPAAAQRLGDRAKPKRLGRSLKDIEEGS